MMSLAPLVASFVAMYLLGAKSLIFKQIAEQARVFVAQRLPSVWSLTGANPLAQSVERRMQIQAAVREEVRPCVRFWC